MGTLQLHINSLDDNISLTKNSMQIWGRIHVELDGCCFPDEDWNDVISSIFDMWIPTIVDFLHSGKSSCELYFMDGPYRMCLKWISTSEVKISMFGGNSEVTANTCNIIDFLEAITKGINSFCELCRESYPSFISSSIFLRIIAGKTKLNEISANFK